MRKAAYGYMSDDAGSMALMGSLLGSAANANFQPSRSQSEGTMGGGMRDIGLAQLYQTNPQMAALAAARLEAETAEKAMGPLEGTIPGGLAGGALGGLLGAGIGAGMGGGHALGLGLAGGLTGMMLGGKASQEYERKRRSAEAYEAALARLGEARPEA